MVSKGADYLGRSFVLSGSKELGEIIEPGSSGAISSAACSTQLIVWWIFFAKWSGILEEILLARVS